MATPEQRMAERDGALRLLVVGGSQGARILNEVLPAALALMAASERPRVRHQSGATEHDTCAARYRRHGIDARVDAFIDDMSDAYRWADLVVCRAGALTVSELAVAGVASILVPLPGAIDDHQSANARWLADAGAAQCVRQSEFTPQWLAGQLACFSRVQLLRMAQAAQAQARPAAALDVARVCMEVAR